MVTRPGAMILAASTWELNQRCLPLSANVSQITLDWTSLQRASGVQSARPRCQFIVLTVKSVRNVAVVSTRSLHQRLTDGTRPITSIHGTMRNPGRSCFAQEVATTMVHTNPARTFLRDAGLWVSTRMEQHSSRLENKNMVNAAAREATTQETQF